MIFRLLCGYVAAAFVGNMALTFVGLAYPDWHKLPDFLNKDEHSIFSIAIWLVVSWPVIAATFSPATLAIAASERLGTTDWIYFGFWFAVSSLVFMTGYTIHLQGSIATATIILAVLIGGIGGLTYWLISGRYAGLWREAKAGSSR